MNSVHRLRDALVLPLGPRIGSRPADGDPLTLLILQPDHLGDILLSQPAVLALREALPDHRLVAVVGPWSEQIARMAWPVDEIVTVEFPGFTRSGNGAGASPYIQLRQDAAKLRNIGAGDAVILRPDAWWAAWLAWLSVPGHVVTADDFRSRHFATVTAPLNGGLHAAERSFAIALTFMGAIQDRPAPRISTGWHPERSGAESKDPFSQPSVPSIGKGIPSTGSGQALRQAQDANPKMSLPSESTTVQNTPSRRRRLTLPPKDVAATQAKQLLAGCGVTGRYAVVHPGSGAPVKLWPPNRWRAVISRLAGMDIILTGSAGERDLCADVAHGMDNVHNLSGETPLDVLIEVLRGAEIVAGPDSGPLHLAVATGTPSLHLFGPSDPSRYGPWGPPERHRVVSAGWTCPRCGDLSLGREAGCGCMLAISPDDVTLVIEELMARDAR